MKGRVHSIESFATLDGTGIRCAVFLSGCPLRCVCCHNPDTWAQAGKEIESEELARKVLRFRSYFSRGGGVTWSGGEPLLQADFAAEVSDVLRAKGVHVALDTSGCVRNAAVSRLLDRTDLVICDLKYPTDAEYRKFAGCGLSEVLAFLGEVRGKGIPFWLRTVAIPGINADEAHMDAYAELARGLGAEKYELLGFHTLGFSKYETLGIQNPLAETSALAEGRLAELQKYLDGKLYEGKQG